MDKINNNKKEIFELDSFLKNLPTSPGVYRFTGAQNEVLYVGKAKDLKKRVSSYFKGSNLGQRIEHMVQKIKLAEITPTRSESEALLLENNLIKTLSPKYNILFRDDKSYPYLKISHHNFPRISYYRGSVDDNADFFGPFPNAWAVRESIHILQKVFKLRNCTDSVLSNRSRPCLLFQINRCSGPCVQKISQENYSQDTSRALNFLRGKHKETLEDLQNSMHQESENLNYEKAAAYRDQIAILSKILEQNSMEVSDKYDCDVLAVASDGQRLVVNLAMVRGGRHLGDRSFFSSTVINAGLTSSIVLSEGLFNFIIERYKKCVVPKAVIVNQRNVIANLQVWLKNNNNPYLKNLNKTKFLHSPRKPYKDWLLMAENNAKNSLLRRSYEFDALEDKTKELLNFFNLSQKHRDPSNFKIECFDVSHFSGECTYCSCVVFQNFAMQNSQYRRFLINEINAGDDYGALRQALERRFREKNNLPDIALIDGGKGQLNVMKEVFEKFNINSVLCAGIVKGEKRRVGLERLIMADGQVFTFENNKSVLMTLAKIRDEAHRFAISGMRSKKSKVLRSSVLDEIEGIGPSKRKALLSRFGGLHGLKRASESELATVNGISRELSKKIFSYFN